jgi:hypothetical protein
MQSGIKTMGEIFNQTHLSFDCFGDCWNERLLGLKYTDISIKDKNKTLLGKVNVSANHRV